MSPAPAATVCPFQRAGVVVTPYPWPLCNVLELAALPNAVPCARLHVRLLVLEWGLGGLAESAELLTSELVTNAVQAMAGQEDQPAVGLRLSTDRVRVLIEIWCGMPTRGRWRPGIPEGTRRLLPKQREGAGCSWCRR